jgi:hypothetical protein
MDETPTNDQDDTLRAFSCELAQWLFQGSDTHPANVQEFIAAAATITHFITNGEGVAIICTDKLRPTVRGGI